VVTQPGDAGSDVERAVARLSDDDQELLRLVAWEELGREEIALVLGISRTAVRVRLHRARRRLADEMAAPREPLKRSADGGQVMSRWARARPGIEEA
jgi:RNA polymerase sigma-70 factor (ECF subfamily)